MLYGKTDLINTEIDIYRNISREDIREVARKYLNADQRVELKYIPKQN
jgi:(2Fe-2S) ferredoxin